MRGIRRFAAPCGLGLAVFLNLPAGLAAAPASQAPASHEAPASQASASQEATAPTAAAAALSAVPAALPWAAGTVAAGAPQIARSSAGREAGTPPSLDEFLAALRGEQPQPASSCSAMTACLCGGTVSCSGSTCSQGVGCFVVCDGVEHDCRGCSGHPCA